MSVSLSLLGGDAELDAVTYTDCKFLNTLDVSGPFLEVVTVVLRSLYQPSTLDIATEVDSIAETHGLKIKPLRSAVRTLVLLLRGAVKHSISGAALQEDFAKLGVDESHGSALSSQWTQHSTHIASYTRTSSAPHVGDTLVDLDWRFGVTVSTDDVAKVGSTYVQLKLTLNRNGTLVNELMELQLNQFYDLLGKLERAKSYVDYLSGTATTGTS